jgi:hypothetical protein
VKSIVALGFKNPQANPNVEQHTQPELRAFVRTKIFETLHTHLKTRVKPLLEHAWFTLGNVLAALRKHQTALESFQQRLENGYALGVVRKCGGNNTSEKVHFLRSSEEAARNNFEHVLRPKLEQEIFKKQQIIWRLIKIRDLMLAKYLSHIQTQQDEQQQKSFSPSIFENLPPAYKLEWLKNCRIKCSQLSFYLTSEAKTQQLKLWYDFLNKTAPHLCDEKKYQKYQDKNKKETKKCQKRVKMKINHWFSNLKLADIASINEKQLRVWWKQRNKDRWHDACSFILSETQSKFPSI